MDMPGFLITLKKGRGRIRWVSQLTVPDRCEWNEQTLHECMYPHDVAEVLKIRLSERVQADHIAWFYEKSEIFTMRSAYNLAMRIEKGMGERAGSSARIDGTRPLYADIWKAKVPAKVRIFVWPLAQEGLATQVKRARKLETEAKCQLCGKEEETDHHAVVQCDKAKMLRSEMRKHWILPEERLIQRVGLEWLLTLLNASNKETTEKAILLFWRAWFLRNDAVHGNGMATVRELVEFLSNYASALNIADQATSPDLSTKGKKIVNEGRVTHRTKAESSSKDTTAKSGWCAPLEGWVKLNADACFREANGHDGTGVIIRDWCGDHCGMLLRWNLL
jgi:hypothetical protein